MFLGGPGFGSDESIAPEGEPLAVLTAPTAAPRIPDDTAELLRVLGSIPLDDASYGAWWNTADGRWLYGQVGTRVGIPLANSLRSKYGISYEAADVANTAFTVLRQDFVHAYILRAENPWAYLSQMLKREMLAEAGTHFRVELTEDALFEASAPPAGQSAVSIRDAAEMTFAVLAPGTPDHLRASLREAITYFSELGGARLSHLYTHATSDVELTGLGLVREEILAIANAVLGSRPNNAQTSLIAAFLKDPAFNPRSSILHRRALNKFQARMAASTKQEALVG